MHRWLERKVPERTESYIDQAESRMIDRDVTAALCAIPAVANVAALESSEEFRAFGEPHVILFPQRERARRRSGIATAVFAMTVTHLQRFAAHLDLHRSAVTPACVRVSHASTLSARFASRRAKLLIQKYGVANCGGKYR